MVVEVFMPQLGLTMDQADIIEWTKAEGDRVQVDETLLVVETDKAATDVPSPADGILGRIVVPEGREIPVGTILAYIAETKEDLDDIPEIEAPVPGGNGRRPVPSPTAVDDGQPVSAPATAAAVTDIPRSSDGTRIFASPRAR